MAHYVMATGGTGGHIYPAVAVAQELIRRGHTAALLGQRGGMEQGAAQRAGLDFLGVEAGKLVRSGQGRPDPRELLRAAGGVVQARRALQAQRPAAVVGYGGFASLPGVLAAQSLGIPTVLHEQNAHLGLTQRLAVGRARAVGTAYDEVIGLPQGRGALVGMPVREERLTRPEALGRLQDAGLALDQNRLTLLVMGGSQGSLALNQGVPAALRNVLGSGELHGELVQVLHSTGPRWLEEVRPVVADLPWYHVTGFVDAPAAWSVADLGITRAGTGTLAEAAFYGVPLIMVPLPESAENHQLHNAQAVQRAGAGRLVEQSGLAAELGGRVLECGLPGTRQEMRRAAQQRSPAGAAARLADLIEQL
ncbi:undecaprenyldiphospho-muramoylpentapeptide beta-N-acetylglucosaminyltransferase [Deinococcus radiophilus]|uniref:UDP-N-acetylglucosamine--N-acetylmuramyl-(pentapeptide) pyrophosphoryl-undecaprenol N-acetylglucosamine transferase n=1 Tax=Deinococcus radiophilus TaxID=32062 RepID=A0A431W4D4_9DEIO|nr:undecaprenyldiphospho-muramoylpentapeptide beta-N-acetylglucosaminyltransferase [Deinococcus radiophilus]RTR30308.1 undecaprenyldiphospho-muramoylpentapeptide beta-N-acetylglucosaminyltransferase [Deinococcus radiophilus]UFA49895.1 undecaprenyldiphospho-muramoylpentapeptide beta-N-acetylglucosaminyltransferase [Deinococcus radiophilus]